MMLTPMYTDLFHNYIAQFLYIENSHLDPKIAKIGTYIIHFFHNSLVIVLFIAYELVLGKIYYNLFIFLIFYKY
jgi:hypothetical protein